MNPSTLPITRIVNVQAQLTPSGAQTQSLSDLLVLSTTPVIDVVERLRTYSSLDEVAADFDQTDNAYMTAALWFSQSPQPTRLLIGRWARGAAAGGLRGATIPPTSNFINVAAWNAITNGSFSIAINGASAINITGLNFSSAVDLNGVAAIITAALTGVTCVWNANYQRFEFISSTVGNTSAIAPLGQAPSGTDLSTKLNCAVGNMIGQGNGNGYPYPGMSAESTVKVMTFFDDNYGQQFYGVISAFSSDADDLAFGQIIEAMTNKHVYFYSSNDTATVTSVSTSDLASQLKALGLSRTMGQYTGAGPNTNEVASAAARLLGVDYTGSSTALTLMFKQEPGIVPLTLPSSQVDVLASKNINAFLTYNNGTSIFQPGVMADGTFADIVTGTDAFVVTLQTACYNLLYTSPTKIPQTDAGMHLFVTQIEQVCDQFVNNGFIAPGVWNSAGFGTLKQGDFMKKGYYVYAPPVSSQSVADRAARKSVSFQVAIKLAGAVHSVLINVVVNQ